MSGIVAFSRRRLASYTVTECRYIMFWAKTSPVPEAATDFGEIAPPKVVFSESRPRLDGGPVTGAGAVVAGAVVAATGVVAAAAGALAIGRTRAAHRGNGGQKRQPGGDTCLDCDGPGHGAADDIQRKRTASHDAMSSSAARAIAVGCSVKPWGDSG